MSKEIIYSDVDISFRAHPLTGNLLMKTNKNAIAQAIKNLVLLNKYEDLFNPSLYTDVSASLFELDIDAIELSFIRERIENTIANYEERATLLDVRVHTSVNTPNAFTLSILYMPQNAIEPETVDIFLERIR